MTDARIPDRWLLDRRFSRLSGNQFRAFIAALTWSASNRTDGVIAPDDLPEIRWLTADDMPAFVAAGLCARLHDGWLIVDFLSTQTTRAQWEQRERSAVKERARKARHRAKTAAQGNVPRDRDADRDADGDADSLRTGQDRQGQDRSNPRQNGAWQSEPEFVRGPDDPWPAWRGVGPDPFQEHR
ncbi:hypothetical protein [Mycobacterium sp. E787]|uniref:hypothetical protein n=1 Tax=Mycobacterium sp. E787 TaxID=1834150 RepID=UPI0009EE690E|nr:hypothetical protein [Mycobacterium sp. E787]